MVGVELSAPHDQRPLAAGWPGEKAVDRARKNRVYVALSFLRKSGLSRWLLKEGDGYRLIDELRIAVGAP